MSTNACQTSPLIESDLTLPGRSRGKVRDIYRLPTSCDKPDRLLIVASDRLSAFDVVLPTPICGKGRLLTEIAGFWLRWIETRGLCETHLVSTDADDLPRSAFGGRTTRDELRGRVTIGRLCRVVPVECVVRGYIEGSGWKDYKQTGAICGIDLPAGLKRCEQLPEPVFTPATKAEQGEHDENIGFDAACALVGGPLMERLRETSLTIYQAASDYARQRGIIIADTKFEFGLPIGADGSAAEDAEPILIDEALTMDSSRFWPADDYEPGRSQASYDKQFVREYLEKLVKAGKWDKSTPGPMLPDEVIAGTLERYRAARDRLMG